MILIRSVVVSVVSLTLIGLFIIWCNWNIEPNKPFNDELPLKAHISIEIEGPTRPLFTGCVWVCWQVCVYSRLSVKLLSRPDALPRSNTDRWELYWSLGEVVFGIFRLQATTLETTHPRGIVSNYYRSWNTKHTGSMFTGVKDDVRLCERGIINSESA